MSNLLGYELWRGCSLLCGGRMYWVFSKAVASDWFEEWFGGGQEVAPVGEGERVDSPVENLRRTARLGPTPHRNEFRSSGGRAPRFASAVNLAWGRGPDRAAVRVRHCSDGLVHHVAYRWCWLAGNKGVGGRDRGPPSCAEIEIRFRTSDWRS